MMADPDYVVDAFGLAEKGQPPCPAQRSATGRPFISVHFACCNVYARVYVNPAGDAYVGWCPKCARRIVARIGPEGTTARMFTAS